jgi:hypothetical protein
MSERLAIATANIMACESYVAYFTEQCEIQKDIQKECENQLKPPFEFKVLQTLGRRGKLKLEEAEYEKNFTSKHTGIPNREYSPRRFHEPECREENRLGPDKAFGEPILMADKVTTCQLAGTPSLVENTQCFYNNISKEDVSTPPKIFMIAENDADRETKGRSESKPVMEGVMCALLKLLVALEECGAAGEKLPCMGSVDGASMVFVLLGKCKSPSEQQPEQQRWLEPLAGVHHDPSKTSATYRIAYEFTVFHCGRIGEQPGTSREQHTIIAGSNLNLEEFVKKMRKDGKFKANKCGGHRAELDDKTLTVDDNCDCADTAFAESIVKARKAAEGRARKEGWYYHKQDPEADGSIKESERFAVCYWQEQLKRVSVLLRLIDKITDILNEVPGKLQEYYDREQGKKAGYSKKGYWDWLKYAGPNGKIINGELSLVTQSGRYKPMFTEEQVAHLNSHPDTAYVKELVLWAISAMRQKELPYGFNDNQLRLNKAYTMSQPFLL